MGFMIIIKHNYFQEVNEGRLPFVGTDPKLPGMVIQRVTYLTKPNFLFFNFYKMLWDS